MIFTHPTYKIIFSFFEDIFKKKRKISIIDYGCGSAYLLTILPKNRIEKYWGFEISKDAIASAQFFFGRDKSKKFILLNSDFLPKFRQRKIDIVVAIGVLQYMTDLQIACFISESSKSLVKGGYLLISCVTDHFIYRFFNLYGLLIPNRFLSRAWLEEKIIKGGFKISYSKEKGLIFGPFFYHNLVLVFDFLDKIFFYTKGSLGFFGKNARKIAAVLAEFEYLLPIDFGYTLYVAAVKK